MKILLRALESNVERKQEWFSKPICGLLQKKGVQFGFQLSCPVDFSRMLDCPLAVHLPGGFANQWQGQGERISEDLQEVLDPIIQQKEKLLYVVLHGLRVNKGRPDAEGAELYISDVSAEDYVSAFKRMVKLVEQLMDLDLPIAVENVAFTNFHRDNEGVFHPKTFLDLRIPVLVSDMERLRKETGCKLVLDIEHLAFALKFANRRNIYARLPDCIPQGCSNQEAMVLVNRGIFIRKDRVPVVPYILSLEEEIKKVQTEIFHISGCCSNGEYSEIKPWGQAKKVVGSHDQITDSCNFRELLAGMLRPNSIIVPEVAGPDMNPCHAQRPDDAEEKSFLVLCEIIEQELGV